MLVLWQHIFLLNELRSHDLVSFDCGCSPKIDYRNRLVIHNSLKNVNSKSVVEEAELIIKENKED